MCKMRHGYHGIRRIPEFRIWLGKKKGAKKLSAVKPKLTPRKTMLVVAFTCSPPRFSITALPKGKTVDSEYMIKLFQETRRRFSNLRKNPAMFDDMLLQMDNARPHTAVIIQQYLAAMGLRLVYQSPDLNICDWT